jgi:putative transposase
VPKHLQSGRTAQVRDNVDCVPRAARCFVEGGHYHITSRGNDSGAIFVDDTDRQAFISLLGQAAARFGLDVHAWCLMTNHYHLIVRLRTGDLSRALHFLNGKYALRHNERHGRTGHLFSSRFRAAVIADDVHLARAIEYVLFNPVRAGIVAAPADWPWAGAVGAAP